MNKIEEILKENKIFVGKTEGDSMLPMLRSGVDTVVVEPPAFPLKKFDVPVYRRDGHYTMHRIIRVRKKGYVICGDNRCRPEFDVTEADIIGVLTGFYRGETFVSCQDEAYLAYAKKISRSLWLRMVRGALKKCFKNIPGSKKI